MKVVPPLATRRSIFVPWRSLPAVTGAPERQFGGILWVAVIAFVPAEHAWRKVERTARKLFMFAVESMPVDSIINFLSRELQLTS